MTGWGACSRIKISAKRRRREYETSLQLEPRNKEAQEALEAAQKELNMHPA